MLRDRKQMKIVFVTMPRVIFRLKCMANSISFTRSHTHAIHTESSAFFPIPPVNNHYYVSSVKRFDRQNIMERAGWKAAYEW